ncbi:MAG TPA: hypothetical protein PLZ86_01395 [bacterium]|nr:hypothetical protein [bacterium]
MAKKWTKEEVVRLFELLVERGAPIISHPKFRELLSRDQNLLTNQVTREANGNIAYRSVDFDVNELEDEEFWEMIDSTPYQDLIEDNAAIAILKMAEKFNIIN